MRSQKSFVNVGKGERIPTDVRPSLVRKMTQSSISSIQLDVKKLERRSSFQVSVLLSWQTICEYPLKSVS